jgi:integrase
MNTGVRRGELFSLLWTDITKAEVEGSAIEVAAIESGKAKNRKTRRIPLNTEARRVLDTWGRKSEGLVFPSDTGRQLTDIRKAFESVKKKAKLRNFRWHDLRHHFASRMVMAGIPLNTVRELLGHSDIKMTLRYSHLAPGHMRDAVEVISR